MSDAGDPGDRYLPTYEDAICCYCGDPVCPGEPEHCRAQGDGQGGPCIWCGSNTCQGGPECRYVPPKEENVD